MKYGAVKYYLSVNFIWSIFKSYQFTSEKKYLLFIRKRNPSKPITSNSSPVIQIRLQLELFFSNECLNGCVLLKLDVVGIRLKKIASKGVWGNGRLPQLNLPSAVAVAKQGYRFLFAYRNVSDCFYCWLGASLFLLKIYRFI